LVAPAASGDHEDEQDGDGGRRKERNALAGHAATLTAFRRTLKLGFRTLILPVSACNSLATLVLSGPRAMEEEE